MKRILPFIFILSCADTAQQIGSADCSSIVAEIQSLVKQGNDLKAKKDKGGLSTQELIDIEKEAYDLLIKGFRVQTIFDTNCKRTQ